jgi:hypothetical protein
MFFLAFFLLMEDEKSSKKRKPLYKKILNKELTSEQFETLFKNFRSSLETKSSRFHTNYQWFEVNDSVEFAGTPEEEKKRAALGTPIRPKFFVGEDTLIVKLGDGETSICDVYGSFFSTAQSCWPVHRWTFSLAEICESKHYAPRFRNAIISTLQSFE